MQKEEEMGHFVDICGIARVSEVVTTTVDPGSMVRPLPAVRKKLHSMVPYIQMYLAESEVLLYEALQERNMKEKLSSLFVGSVLGLNCTYTIEHRGHRFITSVLSSSGCEFKDSKDEDEIAALYVVASKEENYKCLVPGLVKMFTCNQVTFTDVRSFEHLVKDLLLMLGEEMESILSDGSYQFAEVSEQEKWTIPLAEEDKIEVAEESESSDSEISVQMEEPAQKDEAPSGLKSWPPRAPVVITDSSLHHPRPPAERTSLAARNENPASALHSAMANEERRPMERHSVADRDHHHDLEKAQSGLPHPPPRLASHEAPGTSGGAPSNPVVSHDGQHPQNTPYHPHPTDSNHRPPQEGQQATPHHPARGDVQSHEEVPNGSRLVPVEENYDLSSQDEEALTSENGALSGHKRAKSIHKLQAKKLRVIDESAFDVFSVMSTISFDSNLLPSFEGSHQDTRSYIGRWGEELVYEYLKHAQKLPNGQPIQTVTWINKDSETGRPYDIEVQTTSTTVYIEVKSTSSAVKELVYFSWKELKFAEQELQFHLYRVYSAGTAAVSLRCLENLHFVLNNYPVRFGLEL